jgi:hypothetical protein
MLSSRGSLRTGRDLRLTTDRNLTLQHDRDLRHDKSDPGHLHGLLDHFGEEGGVDSIVRPKSDCWLRFLATGPLVVLSPTCLMVLTSKKTQVEECGTGRIDVYEKPLKS